MKNRSFIFILAIAACAFSLMGAGGYLKYALLRPYGLAQDKNVLELPVLLLTDDALRYEIRVTLLNEFQSHDPEPDPTEMPETTEANTEPPTELTEEPVTEPTAEETAEPGTENTEPSNSLPVHEHQFELMEVVPPSCTAEGYSRYQCSGCEENYTDNIVERLPHDYDFVETVFPTADTEGYRMSICKHCGETYREPYAGPVPIASETYPNYDFSYNAVSDAWFDDALFIGDSRTAGMREWCRSGNADYFCDVGMTVFGVLDAEAEDHNFSKQTLESLLKTKTYGKVFICLGLNESASSMKAIMHAYGELLDLIRRYQPDAKIILQGVLMLSKGYSKASYFQPNHLNAINAEIEKFADHSTVFYIDANPFFTNADGYLYDDITADGCHLYANRYQDWVNWLHFAMGNMKIE